VLLLVPPPPMLLLLLPLLLLLLLLPLLLLLLLLPPLAPVPAVGSTLTDSDFPPQAAFKKIQAKRIGVS